MIFFKNNSFTKIKKIINKKYPLYSADIRCGCERGLISVILPVYNCEKYLSESINSVLSQTYNKLELIIVDDGSTDNSGTIADEYCEKDPRIRVIHQTNLKLPSALNTGFKEAKGEFLTWTSADNRMLPSYLETLSNELYKNRNTDMVFGNMRLIDENGDILRGYGWYELPPLSGNVILPESTAFLNTHPNNTIGGAFLYRKGAQAIIGEYSEKFYTLEDYDFFMRMNLSLTIKHTVTRRPVYEYRIHKDSLTAHDEELKITESRPELMELHKIRQENYLKSSFCYIDGCNKKLEKAISSYFVRINSKKTAERILIKSPENLVYINIGNVTPSIDFQNTKSFLICDIPDNIGVCYNSLLCLNTTALKENRNWVSPINETSVAGYIYHKSKNLLQAP